MIAGVTPRVLHHRPLRSIAAPVEHSIASPRPSRRSPSLSPALLPFSIPAAIKGLPPSPEFPPPLLPSAFSRSLLKLLAPPTQFLGSSSLRFSLSFLQVTLQLAPPCCIKAIL